MKVTTDAYFAAVIILYYLTSASAFVAISAYRNLSHENAKSSKAKKTKWNRVRKAQLSISILETGLCVVRSVLRGVSVGKITRDGDPELVSDLFMLLAWVVLTLGVFDFESGPMYSHHGAWLISLISQAVYIVQYLAQDHEEMPAATRSSTLVVQAVAAVGTLALVIISVSTWIQTRLFALDGTVEEKDPLLAGTEAVEGDKNSWDFEFDDEENKALKELRSRPFIVYLRSFKIFLPYMLPTNISQILYFVGECICIAITRISTIAKPFLLGRIVDQLLPHQQVPWKWIALYMSVEYLESTAGITLVQSLLNFRGSSDREMALLAAVYDRIMDLSADFHDTKRSSTVWQCIFLAYSVSSVFEGVAFEILPSFTDLFVGISVLWALFGPYMGFLVAITVFTFTTSTIKLLSTEADSERIYMEAQDEEMQHLIESICSWKAVTEFCRINYEKQRYKDKAKLAQAARAKHRSFELYTRAGRYLILDVAFLAACCLAVVQVSQGERQVGDFVILTSYWSRLTGPLSSLASRVTSMTSSFVRAERLLTIFERIPMIKDAPDAAPFEYRGGKVEFENVTFSYDGKRNVSEGVSFSSPAGTTTALVGETGGGKSTLLKLLFRYYDVQSGGRITIDDQDLKQIQFESFRQHIGVVPQDPAVFNETILENLRYPDPNLTEDEVQEACKAVSLHDKIMTFTKGYKEKVGEQGVRLSGGELQRLAIARAMLKKPDILILDEATSSVDSVTEAIIQASLDKLCKGKTTFVIAHRLSTILKADQILVIQGGKLVEAGTHTDLLKLPTGHYKKLWSSQLKLQNDAAAVSPIDAGKGSVSEVDDDDDKIEDNDYEKSTETTITTTAPGLALVNDLKASEDDVQDLMKSVNNEK